MRKTDRAVVVLALNPEFAEKIYSGTKTVELRKTRPKRVVTRVMVYETTPVKRVTGWFNVLWIRTFTPTATWLKFGKALGITRRRLREYLRASRRAVILAIGRVKRFRSPMALRAVSNLSRPPQSFAYVAR